MLRMLDGVAAAAIGLSVWHSKQGVVGQGLFLHSSGVVGFDRRRRGTTL